MRQGQGTKQDTALERTDVAASDALKYRPVQTLQDAVYRVVSSPSTHRFVVRGAVLGLLHMACLTLALLAYGAFYYAWVPHASVHKDVWLEPPVSGSPTLAQANVFLDGGITDLPVWQKDPTTLLFLEDQEYDVTLEVHYLVQRAMDSCTSAYSPDNTVVSLDLLDHDKPLYHASRPSLLVPEPRLVRWASRIGRNFVRPFQRAPSMPTQKVRIPLLQRITPWASDRRQYERGIGARVRKGYMATHARVAMDGGAGRVPIQSATLHFDAHVTGLAYVDPLTQLSDVPPRMAVPACICPVFRRDRGGGRARRLARAHARPLAPPES